MMENDRNRLSKSEFNKYNKFELNNGKVTSFFELGSNAISTQNYLGENMLLGIISNIIRPSILSLLLSIITLILLPKGEAFQISMYVTLFVLILLVAILKEMYFDKIRRQSDEKVNNRQFICKQSRVFRNAQHVQNATWGEIRQGDVIFLEQGERVPADVILLDSQYIEHREAVTYVHASSINGSTICQKKKSCKSTQLTSRSQIKRTWENHYQTILHGQLSFQKCNPQLDNFTGYMKLTKDPKTQKLTTENLIPRESIIKAGWIYGLVVYAGMDCKIMKHFTENKPAKKWISNKLDQIFLVCLVINILLGLIFSLLFLKGKSNLNIYEVLTYHFMMFSLLLPHMLYFGNEIMLLYFSLKNKISAEIINYTNITSLGKIDFAIISNNGVLKSGKMLVEEIVSSSSVYEFKEDTISEEKLTWKGRRRREGSSMGVEAKMQRDSKESVRNRQNNRFFMNIANQNAKIDKEDDKPQEDMFFLDDESKMDTNGRLFISNSPTNVNLPKMKSQLEPLRINKDKFSQNVAQREEQSLQIVKAFSLCHQAYISYVNETKFNATSRINSEEVLLKLISSMNINLTPDYEKKPAYKEVGLIVTIEPFGEPQQNYGHHLRQSNRMLFRRNVNSFLHERKLFSVVVENDDKFTIYCKGNADDIIDRIKDREQRKHIIENKLAAYKSNKAEVLIYTKRSLSNAQYADYDNDWRKLRSSLNVTEKEIEEFSLKYENDLQFICIVGFSSEECSYSKKFVNYLTQEGVKMCLITHNNSEIRTLKNMLENRTNEDLPKDDLKKNQIQYIELETPSTEEIRYNLNSLTRKLKSMDPYNYSIVVNKSAWQVMEKNSELMKHFLFALYYSQSLIAYNFEPADTVELVKKLKSDYNRQHTIMSIGSSFSDLLFQNYSDISLSVCSSNPIENKNTQSDLSDIPTDIKASNIRDLQQIIELGSWLMYSFNSLINVTMYRVILVTTVILVFESVILFTKGASFTLNATLMFIYVVIYSIIETIFIILVNRKIQPQQADLNIKFKNVNIKFFTTLIESLIHGLIISISVIFNLPQARIDGKILPAEAVHFCMFILLVSVSNFRHIFTRNFTKLSVLLMTLTTFSLVISSMWLATLFVPNFDRYAIQFKFIAMCYDSIITTINACIFCIACSLFISELSKREMLETILQYKKTLQSSKEKLKNKLSHWKSSTILSKDIELISLVKTLFKEEENIEDSIKQIVGDQIDLNELKINSSLEIRKEESRIKNQISNSKKNLVRFQVLLLLVLLLLISQIIIDFMNPMVQNLRSLIPLFFGVLYIGFTCLYVLIRKSIDSSELERKYSKIASFTVLVICSTFITHFYLKSELLEHLLVACILCILCTQLLEININLVIGSLLVIIIAHTLYILFDNDQSVQQGAEIFYTLTCAIINLLLIRNTMIESRTNFIIKEQNETQTNQINDILNILVPSFVRKFFISSNEKNQRNTGQFRENSVAVLFCYVCNFDSIIEEEGKNVVSLLDELFREFDKLCNNFGVQKIETVGYTYMAATGIKKIEDELDSEIIKRNKTERLLLMAIQMMEKTKIFTWGRKKNKKLQIKVGIHTGEVVVGVIGQHKKQFSLIGTTVNTTSRHCSTMDNGDITISLQAYKEVSELSNYQFDQNKKYMKGISLNQTDHIPVYRYAGCTAHTKQITNSLRQKFKELVMKVIWQQRALSENSEVQSIIQFPVVENINLVQQNQIREGTKRRTTSKALERDFTTIEKMKNHDKEEIEQYNCLLEENQLQKQDNQSNQAFLERRINEKKNIRGYTQYVCKKNKIQDTLVLLILLLINLSYLIISVSINHWNITTLSLRCVSIGLVVVSYFLNKRVFKNRKLAWVLVSINLFLIVIEKIDPLISSTNLNSFENFKYFETMISITIFSCLSGLRLIHTFTASIITITFNVALISISTTFNTGYIYELFYIIFVLVRKYQVQKESLINFSEKQQLEHMSLKQSEIVSQLLPKHAYEKLKNQDCENRLELTDLFEKCTILFADIKGFTQFSNLPENKQKPENVVIMLRQLFQNFDKHCLDTNVYKVYTIGDCYVVLGFTNCYERNYIQQAHNVINMGFKMIETIKEAREKDKTFQNLNMRIGIHTGNIIGGIVGTEIVRYDIYGSDVMVANKFEEKGVVGEIHISEETKKLIDQIKEEERGYSTIQAGQVDIKKLNVTLKGYLVKKRMFS